MSFWHVNFSRIGLRAIAAPCFLTWSMYLLLGGVRKARLGLVLLAGAAYGLGFYTYIAYRLAIYFARHPGTFWGRTGQVSVLRNARPALEVVLNVWRTARMFFRHGDFIWRHNVAWRWRSGGDGSSRTRFRLCGWRWGSCRWCCQTT
jgi:hypothetical protein